MSRRDDRPDYESTIAMVSLAIFGAVVLLNVIQPACTTFIESMGDDHEAAPDTE